MSKIDDYRVLDDIEHCLLRPNTYIGSIDLNEMSEYVFDRKENKFDLKKISYVPGLRKIIDEPIDNAVDEYIRSKHQFANKIKVSISDTEVSISDNGRGIPVEKMPGTDGLYIPEAMFTLTKAGSNFNDDGRDTMGMNGLGVKLSNIWSTQFEVVTSDGKNQIRVKASDNNRKHTVKVTPSTKHGTTVTFSPDLARFKIKKIGKEYQDVVYSRLVFLSFLNPGIAFYFNGEKVPVCKDKAFISYFMRDFEMLSNEHMTLAVGPAEDFTFLSYVNGLFLSKGGTHVDFIANEVVQGIKSKLEKKHKGIKPADVKNKLFVLAFLNDFPDIRFNSQTKDQLSNATGDVKRYFEGVDLEKFCAQVAKNKSITFSVEENYKIKEEFALRKQLGSSEKAADRKKIEKYLPSIKNNKYLVLTEGDSACGGISNILGRQDFGYFPLRGKPLCVYEEPMKNIVANDELINVCAILGISMSKDNNADMAYDYVLIASDQDVDGLHIRGLLIAFFYRFAKPLLEQGRIRFLNTPIMNTKGKDGLPDKWVYSMKEGSTLKGPVYYSKGLGSWKKEDLTHIIKKDGLDTMIQTFEIDKGTEKSLDLWFGKNSQLRKDQLKGLVFSYDAV